MYILEETEINISMEITNSMKEISNKSFDYEVNAGMRFKGKVDLWFWIAMIIGDGILISAILSEPDSIACLVGLIVYNMAFLPFVLRNYVDVSDEHVTIVFGFIKQSISLSELTEVRRTKNPISSTAASLDRIILKGNHKSMMCAVRNRDDFLDLLKRKNPAVQINSKRQKTEDRKQLAGKGSIDFLSADGSNCSYSAFYWKYYL